MKRLAMLLLALRCPVPSYAVECKEGLTGVVSDQFTGGQIFGDQVIATAVLG